MFSSFIHQQLLIVLLKDFKDDYIIYDRGVIHNYKVGSMIYDWILEMNNDTSYEPKEIEFHITDMEKKALWKEANKGYLIKVYDRDEERVKFLETASEEQKELYIKQRKEVILQIYKTEHVEHLLNRLADNGRFIEIDSKINLR